MTEKKDYYSKAKNEMRLSERILAALPGFRGYKEKELRRESDKLVRNHLYRKLTDARSNLKTAFQKLADSRSLEVLQDMDRLNARLDRIAEKVNHASYGYAGFFDLVKIEEEALDRMIDFDNQLIVKVDGIASEVAAFKSNVMKQKPDTVGEMIENLAGLLHEFEEAFDKREEVILGVS